MSIKDPPSLISKQQQQKVFDRGIFSDNHQNDQYNSINLNQNLKSTNVKLVHSESSLFNNRKNNVNSFVGSGNNNDKSHKSPSWKKNEMPETTNFEYFNENNKYQNKNFGDASKNNSTLSLHIAAYENSVEANGIQEVESDVIKKFKQNAFCRTSNFNISNLAFQNPFEFPRQQKDESAEPEVMQFKASQKLQNPNKPKAGEKKTSAEQPSTDNNDHPSNEQHNNQIPNLNKLEHQGEEKESQCASTQSSRTYATPDTKTPQKKIDASVEKITERTQTLTCGDYGDKKIIQSPNYPTTKSSSLTDSSDTTQNLSQDDMNPPVMPIKLPGRKLDVTRKSSKTKTQPSPQPHKRKFLPKKNLFAPGGGDSAHKKRCFERQRKRTRKALGPVVGRMKHKDFLKAVDRHRNSRNVIDCVCEPEQFGCIRSAQFYVSQAGRQTKSFVGTFCCPPWPKICFAKVAFWPPNRGYFFVSYAKHLPWSASLVQKHKIIKAKRQITLDENFSIGLEHSCCDRVEGVTTFVIQNSYKNFIAGFIAKPHKRINAKLWIIYSHPNGSDLSDLMTLMPSPVQIADYLGANIVAYDYPGYGISTGKPSEKTFYSTIDAIIEYVTVTLEVPLESIVLWGYSIGTVCSVHAAMSNSVAGVFLFAPVASIMRTLKSNTCFDDGKVKEKTNCLDSFSNLDMISRVKSPLLIAHGEMDTLIPITHGQALLEKAASTNSKTHGIWCKDVGHNNIPNSSELWKRVKDFLDHEINGAENLRAKHAEHHHDSSKKSTRSRKTHHRKKQSHFHTPRAEHSSTKLHQQQQQQQKTPTK